MPLRISKAAGLLEKHRELLALVEHLEGMTFQLASAEAECPMSEIALCVRHLIRELRHHFEAERRSLQVDFDDDPQLRAALRELDGEHPKILSGFDSALNSLAHSPNPENVVTTLRGAIAMFRGHEAQEDLLFKAGL